MEERGIPLFIRGNLHLLVQLDLRCYSRDDVTVGVKGILLTLFEACESESRCRREKGEPGQICHCSSLWLSNQIEMEVSSFKVLQRNGQIIKPNVLNQYFSQLKVNADLLTQ